jgi:hypothetical protein
VPLANIPPATPNGAIVTVQDVTVGAVNAPWAPVGTTTTATNITETTYRTNAVVGEFIVLPTNICSAQILSALVTNVIASTNVLFFATNTLVVTNINGGTNAGTILAFGENLVTYFTNHGFAYLPVQCVSSNVATYDGIERVRFVRRDFDSLIGQFVATTNTYVLNTLTDSRIVPQTIQRTVSTPDILFAAQDLAPGPSAPPGSVGYGRNINFNTNNATAGLAGPGTIETPTVITFNKVGIQFFNNSPNAYFIDSAEANQLPLAVWGSFDGSTNAPIVYPNGATIESLENMILIGISPGLLPQGKVGFPYGNGQPTFSATGGLPPYTWSLAPDSAGLPPGLFLLPDGTLKGTPVEAGTFDFTIQMTDAGQRSVVRAYFITINP